MTVAVVRRCGGVRLIDHDLVIRPYQWKGSDLSLREFVRTAFNNEIGMQPVETTGDGFDGDADGIVDEVSVADVTATTIYVAGQPRPVTQIELDQLRADLIALKVTSVPRSPMSSACPS